MLARKARNAAAAALHLLPYSLSAENCARKRTRDKGLRDQRRAFKKNGEGNLSNSCLCKQMGLSTGDVLPENVLLPSELRLKKNPAFGATERESG